MDSLTLIFSLLSALLGCSTLVGWILYRKSERRTRDAEADSAEANAKVAELQVKMKQIEIDSASDDRYDRRLKSLHDSLDVVNTQLTDALKDRARAEEIIESKTERIREISDKLGDSQQLAIEQAKMIGRLRLFIQWLRQWYCRREKGRGKGECARRMPQQDPAVPYADYPDRDLLESLGIELNKDTDESPEPEAAELQCQEQCELSNQI